MNYSWLGLLIFSVIYYLSWFNIFSIKIIPVIILLILIELSYGYALKLTDIWSSFKENRAKFRNFIIISAYLNFTTWPLYYISLSLELVNFWGIAFISNIIGLFVSLIDRKINALNERFRRRASKFFYMLFGILFAIDSYFLLDTFTENTFFFNISVSLFIFVIFMGFIIKPFKRKRVTSFLYWMVSFTLVSSISYNAYNTGISWVILIIGLLLYPFFFMLEELKAFIDKFLDNLSALLKKIAASIRMLITGLFNFLKKHYQILRLLICILLGAFTGILFSDLILGILNPRHSLLLAAAIFGLFYGILPSKKSKDYDVIFKQKMTRLITLWVGMTAFIFVIILPLLHLSVLFSIFLLLLSLLGLGAIILIYIYRLEEKQRISILWRFYTLIIFFIVLGIEIVVTVFLAFELQ